MIIVTGTKRSGTSMWMQILKAAGFEVLGEAFPKNWKDTIEAANPHGFYESPFRGGVYYATNPDPRTGHYLPPQATHTVAVKVFVPGLCRSDLAYVDRVVATMRHWREYVASVERLRQLEEEAVEKRGGRKHGPLELLDPVLEWWLENFALVRDMVTRKYAAHMVTYERVLEAPDEVLPPILQWLGAPDVAVGVAAVSPQTQTQRREQSDLDHPHAAMFDELYEIVHTGAPVTNDFLERLNATHQALADAIEADRKRVLRDMLKRRPATNPLKDPLHPDTLQALVHREAEQD